MNVFTGKKYLTLEKYPDYIGGGSNPSFKVKTLIDFGFTKLVLRIKASGYKKKAVEAARLTFPTISSNLAKNITDERSLMDDFILRSNDDTKDGAFMRIYCYNYAGELMGALEDFRHWFKHDIVCFNGCPRGVLYARKINKYFGFSHRGMAAFGIGDRIFDENWKPGWNDLKLEWIQDYCKSVGYRKIPSSIDEAKTYVKLSDIKSGDTIIDYIPFIYRGGSIITSEKEAVQAARRLSIYLS